MSGFKLNLQDTKFVLAQIKIAEAHAAGTPIPEVWVDADGNVVPANTPGATLAVPTTISPYGLRTVDGSYNNITPGREFWGAADTVMPRALDADFRDDADGDTFSPGGPPLTNTNYNGTGTVIDADPRIISNLVGDQTLNNPAAVQAWLDNVLSQAKWVEEHGENAVQLFPGDAMVPNGVYVTDADIAYIPNIAPDEGLSASFNAWMTFFGQFFDHGLDLISKGGNVGKVYIPLQADDPLMAGSDGVLGTSDDLPPHLQFMVLTRATVAPGGGHEATNTTTAFVDQNQTYTSHASHQVFLREYEMEGGKPHATGHLLDGANGGLPTWGEVKAQALMLGIQLTDGDALNIPLLRTDQYGKFIPDPVTGMAQVVVGLGVDGIPNTADDIVVSGTPTSPVNTFTAGAVRIGHAFLDDIDDEAAPVFAAGVLQQDSDTDTGNLQQRNNQGQKLTYDNELLDRHFITGDGRGNENIGLTTVHHVFHQEHNRQVEQQKLTVLASMDLDFINEWLDTDLTNLDGHPGPNATLLQLQAFGETLNWDGERMFQAGRFATEMQYQHLVFEEFARKIQPNIDPFVFNTSPDIDPSIFAEFAHVVYRFGHSMLTDNMPRIDANGNVFDAGIDLVEAFLNPVSYDHINDGITGNDLTADEAAASIIRGMTIETGNAIDEFIVESLRSNLLGLPLDLAALNIARGRDTGVPSLNDTRTQLFAATNSSFLKPYESWVEFASNLKTPMSVVNFIAAYGRHPSINEDGTLDQKRDAAILLVFGGPGAPADRVDFLNGTGAWAGQQTGLNDIDLWIGGLAEKVMPFGGMLGSTFNAIFEAQLENLQDGDRFYYLTRTQGQNLLVSLEQNSFAKLLMANSNLALPGADGIRGTEDDIINRHIGVDSFAKYDFVLEVNQANQADYTAATPGELAEANAAVAAAQAAANAATAASDSADAAVSAATAALTAAVLADTTDAAALQSAATAAAAAAAALNTNAELSALLAAVTTAGATDAVALQTAANAAQSVANATDADALQTAATAAAAADAAVAGAQTLADATDAAALQAQATQAAADDAAAAAAQTLADATDAAALQAQATQAAADDAAAATAQTLADATDAAALQTAANAAQALADAADADALQTAATEAAAADAAAIAAQAAADATDAVDLQSQADAAALDDAEATATAVFADIAAQAEADALAALNNAQAALNALIALPGTAQEIADATTVRDDAQTAYDDAVISAAAEALIAADAQTLADATDAVDLQAQAVAAAAADAALAPALALAAATDADALQTAATQAAAADAAAASLQTQATQAAADDAAAAAAQTLADATDAAALQAQATQAAADDAAVAAAQTLANATDAAALQAQATQAAADDAAAAAAQTLADATDAAALQAQATQAAADDAAAATAQAAASAAAAADAGVVTAVNAYVAAVAADQAADAAAASAAAAAAAAVAQDAAVSAATTALATAAAAAAAAATAEADALAALATAEDDLALLIAEGSAPGKDPIGNDPVLEALGQGKVVRDNPNTPGADTNYLRFYGGEHIVAGGTNDADIIITDFGDDGIWGDAGNDRIESGAGVDLVNGGGGNDIITDSGDTGDFLKGDEGDDVIANSNGIDILMGGTGQDAVFVGVDSTEVFAGQGTDFVLGGDAADLLIGNEGDDWLEAGAGFDTTAGDNSELNFDSKIIGHDVMFAGADEHDHDGESGDDIMVESESVVRSEGMFGFDWVIHKGVQTAANVDMGIPIFTTEQADILRDRYDKVEGASGWKFNDVLIGDDRIYDANANAPGNINAGGEGQFQRDELDLAGRDRISGLDQVITDDLMFEGVYGSDWSNDVKDIFSGGNVLLGGGGSDLIAGKGGNDVIDGDRWLNVRISIKSPTNANIELATVDSLEHVFGAGSPAAWVGKSLFQLMIDRVIVPSQLQIVREVLDGSEQGDVDTAMFWDQIQNYTLTRANNGTITVTHNVIGAVAPVLPNTTFLRVSDGVDTVRNVEVFRFGDGAGGFIDYTLGQLFPFAATGAPVISDTTPTEGDLLSVNTSAIADLNGLGTFSYQWQQSANGTDTWINVGAPTLSSTFSVPDAPGTQLGALANQFLRVQVIFTDGRGDSEVLTSAATVRPVGANYSAAGSGNAVNFTGTAGDNVIVGSNFNDTLRGLAGDDTILGGNGNDNITGDAGDDVITGGAGNDTIAAGAGVDTVVYAGPVTNYAIGGTATTLSVAATVGNEGVDSVVAVEVLRIGGTDYAIVRGSGGADAAVNGGAGSEAVFGFGGNDTLNGGDASDILNGGNGNDTVNGGDGDDFLFQGSTDGRDLIDGGAGTDTYILSGVGGPETFRIYTRAEALLAGINNIAGNTEIVITRGGTNNASIIAQLDNVEEIKINTLVTTANNGNGNVDGGGTAGDTVLVIGDFTQTSLDYSTIRVEGGNGNDTVDISGLTSAHRIVFDANGGTDSFIGGVRPQDVVTGIPGISASTLSAGGMASDFELMELVQDTSSSFAQSLLEELTLRSGLETASLSMFGPTSPFDHVTGLIDRTDTVDVGVRQLVTDYSLV